MGKENILVTCPRCGGQQIVDDLALSDTYEGTVALSYIFEEGKDMGIETTKDVSSFDYTCLECGRQFTSQDKKK